MAKRGPNLVDPRLARAVEHPIRIDILAILWEGPSSAARIQRRLENVSVNLVSHHMKVLKELGCVELVETVKKRGGKEHIYRAVVSPIISDEEWDRLTPEMRQPITVGILRMISDELSKSLGAGKFDEILDSHLSCSPLQLDREGWSEVVEVLARALDEILEAGRKSLERTGAGEETPMPVTVAILQFPTVESEE
jgi:DNA-binding transcriptional ArsR family regulator